MTASQNAPKNAVVWTEIPVIDIDAARDFYAAVLEGELTLEEHAPVPMWNLPCENLMAGVAGHIQVGKPAPRGTGPTIHLSVTGDLDAVMERVRAAGGEVTSPVISIPAGQFFYAYDPDGNALGLFKGA